MRLFIEKYDYLYNILLTEFKYCLTGNNM